MNWKNIIFSCSRNIAYDKTECKKHKGHSVDCRLNVYCTTKINFKNHNPRVNSTDVNQKMRFAIKHNLPTESWMNGWMDPPCVKNIFHEIFHS